MRISSSSPSKRLPDQYVTGTAWQEAVIETTAPARLRASYVTFEPGARTAWHTHPLGQTLVVVQGAGIVQVWGEPARGIRAGDVIWFPPGEKHWHGASATTLMTHLGMQEAENNSTAHWMEPVSDEQYEAACKSCE